MRRCSRKQHNITGCISMLQRRRTGMVHRCGDGACCKHGSTVHRRACRNRVATTWNVNVATCGEPALQPQRRQVPAADDERPLSTCNRPPAAVANKHSHGCNSDADLEAASLPRRESRRRCGALLHAPHRPSLRLCERREPLQSPRRLFALLALAVLFARHELEPCRVRFCERPRMTAAAAPHARKDRWVWVHACARAVCEGSQGMRGEPRSGIAQHEAGRAFARDSRHTGA
jgi:hypothetical protein